MTLEERILKLKDSQVGWFDGYELRVIAEDVCKMERRIKRLEEAGDAIVDHNIGCGCGQDGPCRACRMACEAWYKAKEAKL